MGPGQNNYIDGWVHVGANMFTGKCNLWAGLRNPLPFHDSSVDAFYSHHMVEYLPGVRSHLQEVFRCLKPDGVCRMGANGDSAIAKFIEDDKGGSDLPESRKSIGGRFENFIFCSGEHFTILAFSMLEELLRDVGFEDVRSRRPVTETGYPDKFSEYLVKEYETDYEVPHTLIVEAVEVG